jgi:hypothetical protein
VAQIARASDIARTRYRSVPGWCAAALLRRRPADRCDGPEIG